MASHSQGTAPQGTVPWANAVDPTILTDESVGNMISEVGFLEQAIQLGVNEATAMPVLNRAAAQVARLIRFVIALWARVKGDLESHQSTLANHEGRVAAVEARAVTADTLQGIVNDAQQEFQGVRSQTQGLATDVDKALKDLQGKCDTWQGQVAEGLKDVNSQMGNAQLTYD